MTLELANQDFRPGYAGPLQAARNPALAERFHFWRGASGRRYACTLFSAHAATAYEEAVALFVRRRGGEPMIVAVGIGFDPASVPRGIDEVHVHLVRGGCEALAFAFRDLAALVSGRRSLYWAERHAA
jgi:hypothetical protein